MLFLWLLGVLLCLPLRAEELLPQVQKELRARKFYFGEIDGRATKETTVAIKRFQLAKGIDSTGHLDGETLRALGFTVPSDGKAAEERRKLESCSNFVMQYLQARESGQWERIAPFFADQVDFYEDHIVARDSLPTLLAGSKEPPAKRQDVMLNRIAARPLGGGDFVQVTVRVQARVTDKDGELNLTEDLIFRLVKADLGWEIASLKRLGVVDPGR